VAKPNPIPNNKPFKKGQSGNPKGRPKLPDIKHLLVKYVGSENRDEEWGEVINKLLERAKVGDTRATELLFKYGFGTPNPMPQENESQPRVINTTYEIVKDEDDNEASS
jgi:hypothetical protein